MRLHWFDEYFYPLPEATFGNLDDAFGRSIGHKNLMISVLVHQDLLLLTAHLGVSHGILLFCTSNRMTTQPTA